VSAFEIKLTGDWSKALATTQRMGDRFKKAAEQAMMKEAHRLRGLIVKGITSGAPGGKPFAALSAMTLAVRKLKGFGGSKPLMWTGALRGAITVQRVGAEAVFVGIMRSAKNKQGKSLVNLGELHEFGSRTFTVPFTAKMRKFLFAAMRAAGLSSLGGKGKGGGGKSVLTIRIPARPFIGPVVEHDAKPDDVMKRFWNNVAAGMGFDLGRP
jgi:hypothetical protein